LLFELQPVAVSNTEILEKKIVKRSTNRQSSRNGKLNLHYLI